MAITDVYFSPSGAGLADGSSAANAYAAVNSGSWHTNVSGTDCEGKRFIFLAGTYSVDNQLTFTGTPTKENPFFMVGADASGNIIERASWEDEKRLRIDDTNLPKFVMTATGSRIIQEVQFQHLRNLSFKTDTGVTTTQNSFMGASYVTLVYYYGCRIEAAMNNTSAKLVQFMRRQADCCSFEVTTNTYDMILSGSGSINFVTNCSFIGPGTTSGGASYEGHGFDSNSTSNVLVNCIVVNVPGNGFNLDSTSGDNKLQCENNTIVNIGNNGIGLATGVDDRGSYVHNNIIYNTGNHGINTNSGVNDIIVANDNAFGAITNNNLNNFGNYSTIATTVTANSSDFFDYTNLDFRIRRDSSLYKNNSTKENYGALQNEDYEFVSVS